MSKTDWEKENYRKMMKQKRKECLEIYEMYRKCDSCTTSASMEEKCAPILKIYRDCNAKHNQMYAIYDKINSQND